MKAILEFNLPDEESGFIFAVHGREFALTCSAMADMLRQYVKYDHDFKTADDAIESIRESLYEFMEGYGVNLEMIL